MTAANDAAIGPRIAEILDTLETELTDCRAAVASVPEASRTARPMPDRWSVAEVLEHLAMVEETIMKASARQLAAAREAGLGRETETSSVGHLLPPARVANREAPLIAPERLRPKGLDAVAAWVAIENVRARFREFVTSCDGWALEQVSFPHPVLGPLNLYQWFLFAAGHQTRHAAQIREIAQQLG